jgi:GNAT superfamily N-acetyltransferase
MTRQSLLGLCFGRSDFPVGEPTLEAYGADGLICSVDVYYRTLKVGGQAVDVAAIAQVATHPNHRRQGYASALLRAAHELARKGGVEWAALFGRSPWLYEPLGYHRVEGGPPLFLVAEIGAEGTAWPQGPIDAGTPW